MDQISYSQILPHLEILNKISSKLTVLSFEKKNEDLKFKKLNELFIKKNIIWKQLKFSKKKFYLIKFIDIFKLIFVPIFLMLNNKYDIIHCRGHLPQISGFLLKYFFKVKLIFDCRGFWIEEKIDQNNLNLNNHLHKIFFLIFKKFEKKLFEKSDIIILLTHSAKDYVIKTFKVKENEIYVIPCCVDYDRFKIIDDNKKNIIKKQFGFEESSIIIGYVGTLSNLYMVEKMFTFFENIFKKNKNFRFLIVTKSNKYLQKYIEKYDVFFNKNICQHKEVSANKINRIYNIFDFSLCFLVPSFARIGTSPIKISESLASGVPVICQKGIGDIDYLSKKISGIFIFDFLKKNSLDYAVSFVSKSNSTDKCLIRNKSKNFLSSSIATKKYNSVYDYLKFN